MSYQTALWSTTNELINESMYAFSLLKDSQYTTPIPYVLYGAPSEAFTQEIHTKRFTYTVSNAPVRNVIAIEAT